MLSRIFTRLFYAVIFFGAGVWAAPHLGGATRWIDDGVAQVRSGAVALWAWGEETFSPAGFKPSSSTVVPAPTTVAVAPPTVAPTPAKPTEPAPAIAAVTPAAPAAASSPTKPDALATARAAFARGDVAGAIRAYEDRLVDRPDDSAAAGELGNVLWANGRRSEAAVSYHRAALSLIGQGRKAEAEALLQPIRAADPALGDDLARRLGKAAGVP